MQQEEEKMTLTAMYTRSVRHSVLPRFNRIVEFRIFLPSSFKKNNRGLRVFLASSTQETSMSEKKMNKFSSIQSNDMVFTTNFEK